MSNLPPEIVDVNSTLVYYRGLFNPTSTHASILPWHKSLFTIPNGDFVLTRVTVRDRTAHDRLYFEILNDPNSQNPNLFVIDQYDGAIRPAKISSSSLFSSNYLQQNISTEELENLERQKALAAATTTNALENSIVRLDSGNYVLRVRVTNGSLSAEADLHIKVGFVLANVYGKCFIDLL